MKGGGGFAPRAVPEAAIRTNLKIRLHPAAEDV